jgi:sigma-B regulation protein RsbU (phosphoserine phosphatase)
MTATKGFNTARRVAQYYQPMTNLSGDWMTVFECDQGKTIYALVGDVTGHGIPQGLVTMAAFGAIQTLKPLVQQNSKSFSPAAILNILRSSLVTILHECKLAMTVSIVKIDVHDRTLTMSSAGHPLPLALRQQGSQVGVFPMPAKAQSPLGFEMLTMSVAVPPFVDTVHRLESDDIVCIFSDGLTEAKNKSKLSFQKPFLNTLRGLDRRYPPSVVLDRVLHALEKHMEDSALADDICLLVIDTKKDSSYDAVA